MNICEKSSRVQQHGLVRKRMIQGKKWRRFCPISTSNQQSTSWAKPKSTHNTSARKEID
jgi:hypothetical protein